MVKSDYELVDVHIQFDNLNECNKKFEFYKKFDYMIEPEMRYVLYLKNEDIDLKFEEPGCYSIFF